MGRTVTSASDEVVRAGLRPAGRADRTAPGRPAGRVAAPRPRPGLGRDAAPALLRPARRAARGDARRRQRHTGRARADPDRAPARRGAARRAARGRRVGRARAAHATAAPRTALRGGRAPRASGRGPLAAAARRRAGGRDPVAAVHHGAARRSRALPDRLCARGGLGGRAHRGAPLHRGRARPARRGARDAARRARHVQGAEGRAARGSRAARRALRGAAGRVGADPSSAAGARRRDDDRSRARDAGARCAPLRPHVPLRHARIRVPARRPPAHELPPPALDAARARDGVRGRRADAGAVPARRAGALPLLLLRRRDADPVTVRHVSCLAIEAVDGAARAGTLRTAHGDVPTPAFMPVGTKATVKTLHPDEVRAQGAAILLGNTYHLHFRPGEDVVAELGGLHSFMGWDGPLLTDSGGFQVFSLRDTLLASDDDGVTFRSVYDGAAARFTPELAAEIQRRLGSDIAMCLDVVPPADVTRRTLEYAVRRTSLWAA